MGNHFFIKRLSQGLFMSVSNISRSWLYTVIRILSLCALVFASMLAVDYYFVHNTFCAEGASCSIVAQSEFGQKYGIFLPTLGLLAYSFFFLTSFFCARTKLKILGKSLSTFWIPLAIICCALGALLFIIVQAFEIHAFCWLCMGIDASALLMVIPAVLLMKNKNEDEVLQPKLHPVLWICFYLLIACGPIALGTRPQLQEPAPAVAANPAENAVNPAENAEPANVVPEYIKSFYLPNKINVVEISSFDCPHCRQLHPQLSDLLKEYGDRINFTRLTIPLGKQKEACVAYYCAEKQKKETQYADCLFEEPSKDPGKLLEYARECSINEDSFKACLTDPASSKAVDDMLAKIRESGFEGAPTIWIDDKNIVGFNRSLGMAPYRAALDKNNVDPDSAAKLAEAEKSAQAAQRRSKAAFHVTVVGLIAAMICLLAGALLTVNKPKEERKRTFEAVSDKESAKKEDDEDKEDSEEKA